jgi:hypothetical protein
MNRTNALTLYAAKLEATEGVDAVPTATADTVALLAPFAPDYDYANKNERATQLAGHINGSAPLKPTGRVYSWAKSAHLRGTVGAPSLANLPECHPWLVAARMAATFDATPGQESVAYTPASSGAGPYQTLSEYVYEDGLLHRGVAARTDLKLSFDAGGPLVLEATSQGIYAGVADVAFPTAYAFRQHLPPVAVGIDFSVDGFAAGIIRKFSLMWGNNIQRRGSARAADGHAGFRIGSRSVSWEVVLEEPTLGVKDFRATADQAVDVALSFTVGAEPYNRVQFTSTAGRLQTPKSGDDSGLKILTLAGGFYGPTPFTLALK